MVVTSEIGNAGVRTTTLGHRVFGPDQLPGDPEQVFELRSWHKRIAIYDRMWRTDSRISATMRAVTQPIIGGRWMIDPRNAPTEVTDFIAQELGLPIKGEDPRPADRTGNRFDWTAHIRHAVLSLVYGFIAFEQVYQQRTDDLFGIRKLAPRLPHTLTPNGLIVAEDGGLTGIMQRPIKGAAPIFIPIDRLVVYTHERIGANWAGQSLMRPIFGDWKLKRHALEINAIHIDRNGAGVPILTAPEMPEGASTEDQDAAMDEYQELAESYRSGENAGMALPYGAKFDLKGIGGNQLDLLGTIRYHDAEIAASMLAHFASLATARNGSRALGGVLVDLFSASLNATAREIAATATAHIIEDLIDLNFGEDVPAPAILCDDIGKDAAALVQMMADLQSADLLRPDWEILGQ